MSTTKSLARSSLVHDALTAWGITVVGICHFHPTTPMTNDRHCLICFVKHYPLFDPGKRCAAYAYGSAQARSHWGKTGGGSETKEHISKVSALGRGAGQDMSEGPHSSTARAISSVINDSVATINYGLCTQTAPTSVVYS